MRRLKSQISGASNDEADAERIPLCTASTLNDSHPKSISSASTNSSRSPKDTILRRDAVMAYTALKKKLDDYPSGHKEYLELCNVDCEIERDMVDRIIKKSSQVCGLLSSKNSL